MSTKYEVVGGVDHVFHILGIIIPTDFHIFQRDRYTTNQLMVDHHVAMVHKLGVNCNDLTVLPNPGMMFFF